MLSRPRPHPLAARAAARAETGFTVVEIVIAMLVIAMAAAALAASVASSGSAQQKSRASVLAGQAAEASFEQLETDSAWARVGGAGCHRMATLGASEVQCSSSWLDTNVEPLIDLTDPDGAAGDKLFNVTWDVRGIDSAVDEQGARDIDGVRPDLYRASVTISPVGPATRGLTPRTYTRIVNPSGRTSTGSLVLQVCRVKRQYDLRQPVGACASKSEVMVGYPAGGPFSAPDTRSREDWDGAKALLTGPWPKMATYDVRPAGNVKIDITPGPGTVIDPSLVSASSSGVVKQADGSGGSPCSTVTSTLISCTSTGQLAQDSLQPSATIVINGLPPGEYTMTTEAGPEYELWPGASVPAGGRATVDAGERSRIVQVLRPIRTATYRINLEHCETGHWYYNDCHPWADWAHSIQMQPAPDGRAPIPAAKASEPGDRFVRVPVGAPGLYSQLAKDFGSNKGLGLTPGYIWIDPDDAAHGDDVPSVAKLTEYECTDSIRNATIALFNAPAGGGVIPSFPQIWTAIWIDTNGDGTNDTYDHHEWRDDWRQAYTGSTIPECPKASPPSGPGPGSHTDSGA